MCQPTRNTHKHVVVGLFVSVLLVISNAAMAQPWKATFQKGEALMGNGQHQDAIPYLENIKSQVQEHYAQNPQDTSYASLLESLAYCYEQISDYEQAESLYKECIETCGRVYGKEHWKYGKILDLLGSLYSDFMGKYNDAESLLKQTREIYESSFGTDHPKYASATNTLGLIYQRLGRYPEAIPLYAEAVSVFEVHYEENNIEVAYTINNMAILNYQMGNFHESEIQYKRSLRIHAKLLGKDHPEYAKVLSNLSSLYKSLGRFEESIRLTKEAMEIRKKHHGENHPLYANSLNNLATLYSNTNQHEKARRLLRQAIAIEKNNNQTEYAIFLNNLARSYQKTKEYELAEPVFLEAVDVFKKELGEDHPYYSIFISNLGNLYVLMGRPQDAVPLWEQCKEIRLNRLGENHAYYASVLLRLGLLYKDIGDHDKSNPMVKEGTDRMLKLIDRTFPFMSARDKRRFWYMMSELFEELNWAVASTAANGHEDELIAQMYDAQLAIKALIMDGSQKIKRTVEATNDSTLIRLYDRWLEHRNSITKAYGMTEKQRLKEGLSIQQINDSINVLESQLSQKSTFFEANTNKRRSWQEIRDLLQPGEAAIEMLRFRKFVGDFIDEAYYCALIITPKTTKRPKLVVLPNGNSLEGELLSRYKNSLQLVKDDSASYDHYWRPIRAQIPDVEKIYFSAEGVYNLINLNTLYDPDSGRYVLDEVDIQLVTSTKDIIQFAGKNESSIPTLSAVLFGDPSYDIDGAEYGELLAMNRDTSVTRSSSTLETTAFTDLLPLTSSNDEITTISGLLKDSGWNIQSFTGKEAIEERVKKAKNPTVMHIATHGYFQATDISDQLDQDLDELPMMRSGLLLAGVSNYYALEEKPWIEDGILTAFESTTLDLNDTELVVLSACETGLGEVSTGEGVYGLQRGFKIAGANSILMSLWKVNDMATQELMVEFYEEWLQSGDKRQAFHKAQRSIRQKYPKPYHWGGFVMVGDNTVIPIGNASLKPVYWILSGLLLALMSYYLLRK